MRRRTHHETHGETVEVFLNGIWKFTLNNYKMATISIDVEDNAADLATLIGNFNTALTNAQTAVTAVQDAATALSAFQITFTASVVPAA